MEVTKGLATNYGLDFLLMLLTQSFSIEFYLFYEAIGLPVLKGITKCKKVSSIKKSTT